MQVPIEGLRPSAVCFAKFRLPRSTGSHLGASPLRRFAPQNSAYPAVRASIEGLRPFGGLLRKLPPTPVVRASIEGLAPLRRFASQTSAYPRSAGFPLRGFAPSAVCFAKFRLPRRAELKKPFYYGSVLTAHTMPANGYFKKIFLKPCVKSLRVKSKFYLCFQSLLWSKNFYLAKNF